VRNPLATAFKSRELAANARRIAEQLTASRRSVSERMAAGKALRNKVPRSSMGEHKLPVRRKDPVAILEEQAKTRLQRLVPVRYARMLVSPFAFLRGAAAGMAQDLNSSPVTGIRVQTCGDMHVSNFGVFASAERNLVFGINDFDETLPGPWEWDLKRLVASAVVAGQALGADRESCEAFSRNVVASYRQHIREYAGMGYLALRYSEIRDQDLLRATPSKLRKRLEQYLAKAKKRTHLQVLEKMTDLVDDQHRIVESEPLVVRETHTEDGTPIHEAVGLALQQYFASLAPDRRELVSRYRIVDVARKVVGVGSVGTHCWVVFMRGIDQNDPLFLQFKEAQASVLSPYFDTPRYENEGYRVVCGQHLIQGAPDILLGWGRTLGVDFYIRQLRDMKGSYEFEHHTWTREGCLEYCMVCGWALALAHANSGDAAMIAGYVGKSEALDDALTDFAFAYSEQTERDYAELKKAARSGRIQVAKVF
jgi:uncharacterized protein (DUF2252 family)